ncbi:helix-turn-helix domain-containing protein [Pyxidicoccus parkwayensis]|uniref:Helix-turn-helix domain-containing protein n=1 Tax=Pyxidicoccus parkwayensis TaxID=2813578 RepID=A0ABX7NSK4_9BACT|nr:helix-turn-helix domain-containing protein [Pyxidicoccus parkwaysis]QSQ21872.1 helix-turn-helix domain-containing protein [Pyxidicoccus parkwaysis]
MDSLIAAAARALSAGDALGALRRVALREDPPALALRGIAMAQLGEHARARELFRRAARGFGPSEDLARARCRVAEAEVALAVRDLTASPRALDAAVETLEARGDRVNALHARLIAIRRLLLLGRVGDAEAALARLEVRGMPPALVAVAELATADISLRRVRTRPAREALERAHVAARRALVPALVAEVEQARAALEQPAARQLRAGSERALLLEEAEAVFDSGELVVDACHRAVRSGARDISLARRPVLFALARALAEAWPGGVDRDVLIARVFGARRVNDSHRVRLRVEVGRLRAVLAPLARVDATQSGFALIPTPARSISVLLPPIDGESASLLALLSDGEAWSTSALALALGESQRTVQRALAGLEASGRVHSVGRARARRWLSPPLTGFTTTLLLPAALPAAY